jgi:addiction module HigA family antidote
MDGKRKTPALWAVAAREGRSTLPEKAWNGFELSICQHLTSVRLQATVV